MSRYTDRFKEIMGYLGDTDINLITADDIRKKVTPEADISEAVRGLKELQDKANRCPHTVLRCVCCSEEGSVAHFMGSKSKTMSKAALLQRQTVSKLGGRPKGSKNKPKIV